MAAVTAPHDPPPSSPSPGAPNPGSPSGGDGGSAADVALPKTLARLRALPPCLLLTCGLPATGKSWFGRRLAEAIGGRFLQSDVRRKEMFGTRPHLPQRDGYDTGRYSADAKQRTYDSLLETAREEVGAGRSIVVDGSFVQRFWREPFAQAALELGCPFCLVELVCDEETVRERLRVRALDPDEPSEADWNVYLMLKEQVEHPDELPGVRRISVVSGGSLDSALGRVADRLERQAAELRG